AEEKRPGFAAFLREQGMQVPVESRHGMMAFSPDSSITASVFDPVSNFSTTPLYVRVAEAYRNGAGLLFAADLTRLHPPGMGDPQYLVAEQKQTPQRADVRAVLGFAGERKGIAAWLAAPAPMRALQYVSPQATVVAAFVVKTPASIVDEMLALTHGS